MDFILNGRGFGGVSQILLQNNFDPKALRPFIAEDGNSYVDAIDGAGKPCVNRLMNNAATLRRDEWKFFDDVVQTAAKAPLAAWSDLRSMTTPLNIPNAMGKTILEGQSQGDITPATISMDGIRKALADDIEFDTTSLPLPIIHKDFFYTARQLATARNTGTPLDTTMVELATRQVSEKVEELTIGSATFKYGGAQIYGYLNLPGRITMSLTAPTDPAWSPALLVQEILAMKQASQDDVHYGPWALYNSPAWDAYMDDDYSAAKGDNTLRQRIGQIQGIDPPKTLNKLTGFRMILVQKTSDVARAVIGMDITTVQWPEDGGMKLNFKVMAILVPQLRNDHNGNSGIVDAVAA